MVQWMDTIFITDLKVDIRIGVYEWEKRVPQTIQLDLDIAIPGDKRVGQSDKIRDTIDYSKIVETGEPELDTLAREIKNTVKIGALHIDHRKIVTIDGRIAYCGSANFGAQYQYRVAFDPAKNARDEATATAIAQSRVMVPQKRTAQSGTTSAVTRTPVFRASYAVVLVQAVRRPSTQRNRGG